MGKEVTDESMKVLRALEEGDTEHGASVHLVTEELDGGPVLGAVGRADGAPGGGAHLDAEENDLDLECVVCCELYDTSVHAPMVLPCSGAHEICRTCVAALRKADGAIQCPKCREDATGAVNPNRGLIAALRLSRRS